MLRFYVYLPSNWEFQSGGPLGFLMDQEVRGWRDNSGNSLQFWARWLRREIPGGRSPPHPEQQARSPGSDRVTEVEQAVGDKRPCWS